MNRFIQWLNLLKRIIPQFQGAPRSVEAKRNIFVLFIVNGFNFIFNILLVRFTLDYLGQANYGVWVTLASIMTWFGNLDFGLGNGLRNKLAESFARNEFHMAKVYVSTAYAVFTTVTIFFYAIFLLVYNNIEWASVFNTTSVSTDELTRLILFVFTCFTITFILKFISFIILADQKPAINGLLNCMANLGTVTVVFILLKTVPSSLFYLGVGSALVPLIVFFIASILLFSKKYKSIVPSIKFIDLQYSKDLIGLGFQFFVIQAMGLIVFTSTNIIITQLYGPEEVSVYNVAYRYFNYVSILFFVILSPLWSAYTDAYVREDFDWIKRTMKKILNIWMILSALIIVMIIASEFVYAIWLNSKIEVPFSISVIVGVITIMTNWNNIFAFFINGVGKIRLSLYMSVLMGILNIPLAILLAKSFGLGIVGVITASLICLLIGSVYAPMQYLKIINKNDKGIWGK